MINSNIDSNPSCLQLQYNFAQFPAGQPNTVTLAGLDPQLSNAVPAIANVTANELQIAVKTYGTVELIYLFNCAVANGFQNDTWGVLVEESVMGYVAEKRANQYVQDNEAVVKAARRVIATFACFMASRNQTVMQHIQAARQNEVMSFANTYISESQYRKQLRQSITMSMGGGAMPGMMVNHGNVSQPLPQMAVNVLGSAVSGNGYAGFAGPANSFQKAIDSAKVHTPTQAPNNLLARFLKPSAPIADKQEGVIEPVKLGSAAPRTMALTPKGPVEMFRQPSQPAQAAAPTAAPAAPAYNPIAGTLAISWAPSMRQFFKPAFNAMRQKHVIANVTEQGVTHQVYKVTDQDETEMKRSEHEIGSITTRMVNTYLPPMPIPASEQVDASLKLTSAALQAIENKETDALTQELRSKVDKSVLAGNEPSTFVSLVNAVGAARHDAMQQCTQGTYIMPASISMYLLSRESRADFFNDYMDISSFSGMADSMAKFLKDVPTKSAVDFISRLDLYLTREINSVFRVQMGLPTLMVESFMTDIMECKGVIQARIGVYYREQLEKFEQIFLSRFFTDTTVNEVLEDMPIPSQEELEAEATAALAEAAEESPATGEVKAADPEPVISFHEYYIYNNITVCVVDEPRDAFGVVLPEGETQEVFENTLPGLFKYITAVIAADPEAAHHYIVTSDDYVYEVAKSIVGEALVISGRPRL